MRFLKRTISKLVIATFLLGTLQFTAGGAIATKAYSDPTVAAKATTAAAITLELKQKMELQLALGKSYSGFMLKSEQKLESLQSIAYEFVHEATGAKLLYLKNEDENKVFSISFRTTPKDNTGVNHILEHSVLSGSKKYPVKDPFSQMSKQSLNTYLNAATYPDYTTFPVSSKNDKDFDNLMDVYMDSVFYPNIYNTKNTFLQEGVRYEATSTKSPLQFNGIVYNEMKGVYSSPANVLSYVVNKSLFPNSIYRFESGGHPTAIPSLTYQQFLETYKKNYTPSNSYIYLYGKMDLEKVLAHINDDYLKNFTKANVNTDISVQKPFKKSANVVDYYAIESKGSTKDRTYMSMNYVVGKTTDVETSIAMELLDILLMSKPSSPLRRALEDANLAYNVSSSYNNYCLQPVYSIMLENTNENQKQAFQKIITDTLNRVMKMGFEQRLVDSVFNSYELSMKQSLSSADRGNNYTEAVMKGWIYNQSPTLYLDPTPVVNKIKAQVSSGYFNPFIKAYLLNNQHASFVTLKPKPGLDETKAAALSKKLADYKKKLSSTALNTIITENTALKKWQATPDTKEALATIPALSLSDISKKATPIPTDEDQVNGIKLLNHPLQTNGVGYVNMYFDSTGVPKDKLMYLILLSNILGEMNTKQYKYTVLSDIVDTYTGGIGFSTSNFINRNNTEQYHPKLQVTLSALDTNMDKALELTSELINNASFIDKAHLKNILEELKVGLENDIQDNAASYAVRHLSSYSSDAAKYNDLGYLPFYSFVSDLQKNFDKKSAEIISSLSEVYKLCFTDKNLVVGFTGDTDQYKSFKGKLEGFGAKLQKGNWTSQTYTFDYNQKNEGFIMPSNVQYVAMGANFKKLGFEDSGKLSVLSNILNNDYIYQQIRVKNGAYGGYVSMSTTNVALYSYRDPNLGETVNVFKSVPEYLKSFTADENEMTNYIIGAIGGMDGLAGPVTIGASGDAMYLTGTTNADMQKYRDELLSTTAEDIRSYADMFQKVLDANNLCVVGGESKVNADKSLFNKIINLFK